MGEGRDGDWKCIGCKNRNYAFRSFCNRCKQPRLLVDTNTPADSKWLPRIGDWICTGCTNNNYASREKCKKCGQAKEVAAMPATAIPGVSLPTYSHYFARVPGAPEHNVPAQSIPLSSSWPQGEAVKFSSQSASWPVGEVQTSGLLLLGPANQSLSVPKGWRNGDWICNCGFHNYSSRSECKSCNASMPPVGTKRVASEEVVQDWDNKRLNSGQLVEQTTGQQQTFPGFNQIPGATIEPNLGVYAPYHSVSSGVAPTWQLNMSFPQQAMIPTLVGKGAKQWRDGDWMCTNCSNHNYASRAQCNRCKTPRDGVTQPVNA